MIEWIWFGNRCHHRLYWHCIDWIPTFECVDKECITNTKTIIIQIHKYTVRYLYTFNIENRDVLVTHLFISIKFRGTWKRQEPVLYVEQGWRNWRRTWVCVSDLIQDTPKIEFVCRQSWNGRIVICGMYWNSSCDNIHWHISTMCEFSL